MDRLEFIVEKGPNFSTQFEATIEGIRRKLKCNSRKNF